MVGEKIIDEINIHRASLLAMRQAVENLLGTIPGPSKRLAAVEPKADPDDGRDYFLYLDGKFLIPEFHLEQQAVVAGDNKILSVAAASIIAKVYRDGLMEKYHEQYPAYNFSRHKGYATLHHRRMIEEHGLCGIHRLSFCASLAGALENA